MKALWEKPLLFNDGERPQVLRAAAVGDQELWAMTGAAGGAAFGDMSGSIFSVERFAAHGVAITESAVVFLLKNALMAFSLSGDRLWKVGLEAGSVGRVFAGAHGDVVVLLSRRRRFVAERYDAKSGDYLETKSIERRRGLLSRDGVRLWTRDAKGVTCMDMMGPGILRVSLGGNGPMSERGALAVTSISDDELVCVSGAVVRWKAQLRGRDLSDAARLDGLDVEDDEFEAPLAGRAVLSESAAYVPDANGVIHALSLADGALLWRFEGAHYPTTQRSRQPALWGEDIAFVCSDEFLYRVGSAGEERARLELPGPSPIDPVSVGDTLLVFAEGLHAFTRE